MDQPPNHYRLLAIELLEEDVDVISNAADRQMGFLRSCQTGQRTNDAQRLLSEIAVAKACLLDAAKKAEYDDGLISDVLLSGESPSIEPPPLPADVPQEQPSKKPFEFRRPAELGLDDYEILGQLDQSQTGGVFHAKHLPTNRAVALKIVSYQASQSDYLIARFHRKVKILSRLDHPNLVKLLEAGQSGHTYYLATEYVDGPNLAVLAQQTGPMPVAYGVNYTMQAAAGLAFAHRLGVFHRNIKPANLMVNRNSGVIKVVGLGLAKISEQFSGISITEKLTDPGVGLGSADYIAPEQITDPSRVSHRADIYGLGYTMFRLLTGRPPYTSKSAVLKMQGHVDGPIPSLQQLRPDIPETLEAIYQRMVAKRPEERWNSMDDVFQMLQSVPTQNG